MPTPEHAPHARRKRPHPKEAAIRELLGKGLNNATVADLLDVPPRQVARIRTDMGIGPALRNTWRNRPHPKAREITDLLEDGHTNAEIRRRTGADWQTIARMRAIHRIGAPTIVTGPPHPNNQPPRVTAPALEDTPHQRPPQPPRTSPAALIYAAGYLALGCVLAYTAAFTIHRHGLDLTGGILITTAGLSGLSAYLAATTPATPPHPPLPEEHAGIALDACPCDRWWTSLGTAHDPWCPNHSPRRTT